MKTAILKIGALSLVLALCCINVKTFAKSHSRHFNTDKKRHYTFYRHAKHTAKYYAGMKVKSVHFGFNKATVPNADLSGLEKVAKIMIDNKISVQLNGFADRTGGYIYNWKLSKTRANAVKAFLVNKGVDSSRVAATEFGYTRPIASNKTAEGRRLNRRVEIKFVN